MRIAVLGSGNLDPGVYPAAGPCSNASPQRNLGLHLWMVTWTAMVSSWDRPREEARGAQGTYRGGQEGDYRGGPEDGCRGDPAFLAAADVTEYYELK